MATNENLIPIPGRLHSVASDEIVSGANEIYDDKLSDNLENLNTGFTNNIDTIYNTIGNDNKKGAIMEQLNTIDGRLDTIDGEISALNHIPIEVVPLNSAGTAPNVNNPLENTLYRAYNSDRTLYSDWMYKDGSWTMITQLLEPTSLEKLVGYYICNTAANTPGKEVTTGNSGYVLPTNGGSMKIKMTKVNTANNVTLKIGTETSKTLLYNGEAVSASNTWEANEVISVYFDGTNYQASNAQGGGGKAEKIKYDNSQSGLASNNVQGALDEIKGNIGDSDYNETVIPLTVTAKGRYIINNGVVETASNDDFKRAEPIDVSSYDKISAAFFLKENYSSVSVFTDDNGNVVGNRILNDGQGYISFNIPDGATKLYLCTRKNEVTGVYGPFGAKIVEGINIMGRINKADDYLYGDLRTLALGQNYGIGESLKTENKQFLRMTKAVGTMNTTDTVAVGELKVYLGGAGTYKALKAVNSYNGTDTEGLYAIGRPSIVTITVDSSSLSIEEDTDVEVTIGEVTQTITVPAAASETKNADIAALIAAAFTSVPGWTLTDNEDGTLTLRCNTGGANTITVSSNVEETGLSITSSAVNGAATLSKCVEGTWTAVALADYAADSINSGETADGEMWQKLTLEELISYATVQDTLLEKFKVGEEKLHKKIWNMAMNRVSSTPLNLEAGKTYRIHVTLNENATVNQKKFFLRQTASQSTPSIQIGQIYVGNRTYERLYTPSATTNYQYFETSTNAGDQIASIYIYEVNRYLEKVPGLYEELGNRSDGAVSQKALTEMLNNSSYEVYCESPINIAGNTGTTCSLGVVNRNKVWINNKGCKHVVIPCKGGDFFELTASGNGNYYGFLKSYTTPSANMAIDYVPEDMTKAGSEYSNRKFFAVGTRTITIPEGTAYLCLVTRDGSSYNTTWTGTAHIKKPMKEFLDSLAPRSEVQAEVTAQVNAKFQEINDLLHYPSSYIPIDERCEVYVSSGFSSFQGSAVYGNYIVGLSNSPTSTGKGNGLCIYNLSTKTRIATDVPVPNLSVARSHFDTMSFSNTKYDANDLLPLLYVCSGYTLTTSSSVGCVYVLRIINNENVYTTEIVQTINIDYGAVNGWVDFVVDADNNRAWITDSYAASRGKSIVCVNLPSTGETTATIDSNTTIVDSFNFRNSKLGTQSIADNQGFTFYKGRIYWPFGVPKRNEPIGINVLNTLTHCKETVVPLTNYGFTSEPEACFIWNHEFYVVERMGRIFKLIQN